MKRIWLPCLLVVVVGLIFGSSASTAQAQWGYGYPVYPYGAVIVAPQPFVPYVAYSTPPVAFVPAYGVYGYGVGYGYGGVVHSRYNYGPFGHLHHHYHGHAAGYGHFRGHQRW